MSLPSIETLDVDGAVREAEEAVAGDTRATFFRKAAVGGGAVLTSGAIMGMLPELAAAKPSKKQDLNILNYALTLEYLEAEFYAIAVGKGNLSGVTLDFAKLVAEHEKTHVTTLKATIRKIGGKPIKSPSFDFNGTTDEAGMFRSTAFTLENTGVRAYLGQVTRLKSRALVAAASTIVTTEARHAAAIATILETSPYEDRKVLGITPDGAFDKPRSMKSVRGDIQQFGQK